MRRVSAVGASRRVRTRSRAAGRGRRLGAGFRSADALAHQSAAGRRRPGRRPGARPRARPSAPRVGGPDGRRQRRLAPDEAMPWPQAFAEHDVRWFEEPVSSDDLEGLRRVRERAPPGCRSPPASTSPTCTGSAACSTRRRSTSCRATARAAAASPDSCAPTRSARRTAGRSPRTARPPCHAALRRDAVRDATSSTSTTTRASSACSSTAPPSRATAAAARPHREPGHGPRSRAPDAAPSRPGSVDWKGTLSSAFPGRPRPRPRSGAGRPGRGALAGDRAGRRVARARPPAAAPEQWDCRGHLGLPIVDGFLARSIQLGARPLCRAARARRRPATLGRRGDYSARSDPGRLGRARGEPAWRSTTAAPRSRWPAGPRSPRPSSTG